MTSAGQQGKGAPDIELSKEQARRIFGECVDRAYYSGQRTVIVRRGKPVAAIVPIDATERKDRATAEQAA